MTATKPALAELYEGDEVAWLDEMIDLLRAKQYGELDYENLLENLESMSLSNRKEVESRLLLVLQHLLKYDHQPAMRSRSWELTLLEQCYQLNGAISLSRTLRNHMIAILEETYTRAARYAAIETGLDRSEFPPTCPYTLERLLGGEK